MGAEREAYLMLLQSERHSIFKFSEALLQSDKQSSGVYVGWYF